MSKFRKDGKKSTPAVSTASLPDIVFMLLFFFMVTTVMREVDLQIKLAPPSATEVVKLEDKSLVDYIYIGTPYDSDLYGSEPRIQLNDVFAVPTDVPGHIEASRASRDPAVHRRLITSLKVDSETKMGIVTEVKQELRKVQALKINYSTLPGGGVQ